MFLHFCILYFRVFVFEDNVCVCAHDVSQHTQTALFLGGCLCSHGRAVVSCASSEPPFPTGSYEYGFNDNVMLTYYA